MERTKPWRWLVIAAWGWLLAGQALGRIDPPASPVVAGYFASWATYHRPAPFERIAFGRLTHLIYAHAAPTASGDVVAADFVADLNHAYPAENGLPAARGNYARLRQVRAQYPGLRTLISIGGWDRSRDFPAIAADPALRQRFAQRLVAFLARHGFDGAVIDWRYPVVGGAPDLRAGPADAAHLLALMQALRNAFDAQAPARHYTLALTLGGKLEQSRTLDVPALAALSDFVVLLAYDYTGTWRRTTGHNAPLRGPDGGVATLIDALAARGVPGDKLVLGIDNQGNAWTGVPPQAHGLGQPSSGALLGSWDDENSGATGLLDHDEVLTLAGEPGFVRHWDEQAGADSLYHAGKRLFVTYESARALRAKLALADAHGYRGVALWELSGEVGGDASLLRQAHLHYDPLGGHAQNVLEAWRARPPWADPLAGALAALLLALGGGWGWRRWHGRRQQALAVRQHAAQLWLLLPLLQRLRDPALAQRVDPSRSPGWVALRDRAARLEAHLALAAPARPSPPAAVIDVTPLPDAAPAAAEAPSPAGRLAELNALLATLGEHKSAERMLEVMMQFLAERPEVAGVALMQDGAPVRQAGDAPAEAEGVLAPGVHFSDDRRRAWLNADDGSDYQLTLTFHAPADAEDEALLHHLARQIALVRQHLTELTRQPHVLSELYEIASRRDKLLFIRADKGYSGIHTADGGMPLYVTLRLRAIRLYFTEDVLLQVHRSYLVNPRRVTRANHVGKGQYELLVGRSAVPVRRQVLPRLRELYPQWFGA
ncbi:glycosyl hydrolase family 18 protein [Chitiniphilus shinanonensis]|uniref:glycosyl hydrolase family 18 protein n=2 Tax=Chitiniphilus shinanonensis TaxID=553088 RepID=UPI0004758613|nr:glycosyl hydrolase family 18 protein [Chitiniphilus shinanonensis]